MSHACPSCKDENTQRLSLAYESGLSDVNTRSSGVGVGIGRGGLGVGVGGSKTRGTSQTELSKKAAPPNKKSYWRIVKFWFVGTLVAAWVASGANSALLQNLAAIATSSAALYFCYQVFVFNSNDWPVLVKNWQATFMCSRCGHNFIPGGTPI